MCRSGESICMHYLAVDCKMLQVPFGVAVVAQNGTSFGSSIEYTCNSGLILVDGSRVRVCEADGQWSGSKPLCQARGTVVDQ